MATISVLYLAALTGAGLLPSTTARRLAAIRQFFRFLFLEGHRADDPSAQIDRPRQGRRLPKLLEVAEIEALIAAARAKGGSDRHAADGPARAALRHRPEGQRARGPTTLGAGERIAPC